jgi:hypothetical protein
MQHLLGGNGMVMFPYRRKWKDGEQEGGLGSEVQGA